MKFLLFITIAVFVISAIGLIAILVVGDCYEKSYAIIGFVSTALIIWVCVSAITSINNRIETEDASATTPYRVSCHSSSETVRINPLDVKENL